MYICPVAFENWKPLKIEILVNLSPPKQQLHRGKCLLALRSEGVYILQVHSRKIMPAPSWANLQNSQPFHLFWVSQLLDQIFRLVTNNKYFTFFFNDRYKGIKVSAFIISLKVYVGLLSRSDEGSWDKTHI